MASSSSRRTTLGADFTAARKTPRNASSLSPKCALTSSGPLTTNKLAFDACAAARARRVFPEPGGPWSKTPRGGLTPHRVKTSGERSGSVTSSRSAASCALTPPRVSNETFCAVAARDARLAAAAPTSLSSSSSFESSSAPLLVSAPIASAPSLACNEIFVRAETSVMRSLGIPGSTEYTSNNALVPSRGKRTMFPTSNPRPSSARLANASNIPRCLDGPLAPSARNPRSSHTVASPPTDVSIAQSFRCTSRASVSSSPSSLGT
mmetsp:Transcript_886/g.2733  ORF Transcript_886/g.2733 Transcript_886/m.2733 type:complete len:264 (-) Transcript_886:700-1491(-)